MKAATRDLDDRLFWIPKEKEIKDAVTTDIYFQYAVEALEFAKINPIVTMEVYTRKTPFASNWAVVCGIYEVAKLLEGVRVDVDAFEEGDVFLTDPNLAIYEPIVRITGHYKEFAKYENPILGFLCQSSGICTKAARMVLAAEGKIGMSFGTRRAHPALAAMIERSSFIGGIDSVSNVLGAKLLKTEAGGTMPHSFIICVGDEVRAWKIFDEAISKKVPRIALIDTFSDEKIAAIKAFEALGENLYGVRLDTPSTRRGDLKKIVQEVRWELGVRGGSKVKIFVSGGLDEAEINDLKQWVDGFGIGTSISTAPVLDFGGKIVFLVDDSGNKILSAKRGDLSGVKNVFRDPSTFSDVITLGKKPPSKNYKPMLQPLLRDGVIVRDFLPLEKLKRRTVRDVKLVSKLSPRIIIK
ncbi:MAG: nicotinate phosphoribosyltransferase [Thaumarchaeota archaeon]|nr:nicotinate phosphoribosyltransferase [Nitrososphaerota archaeon]